MTRNSDFNIKGGDADSKIITDLPPKYDERTIKFMNAQQRAMNKADSLFNPLEEREPNEIGIFAGALYTTDARDITNTAYMSFNNALQEGLMIGTRNFADINDEDSMKQLARDYMLSTRIANARKFNIPGRKR